MPQGPTQELIIEAIPEKLKKSGYSSLSRLAMPTRSIYKPATGEVIEAEFNLATTDQIGWNPNGFEVYNLSHHLGPIEMIGGVNPVGAFVIGLIDGASAGYSLEGDQFKEHEEYMKAIDGSLAHGYRLGDVVGNAIQNKCDIKLVPDKDGNIHYSLDLEGKNKGRQAGSETAQAQEAAQGAARPQGQGNAGVGMSVGGGNSGSGGSASFTYYEKDLLFRNMLKLHEGQERLTEDFDRLYHMMETS